MQPANPSREALYIMAGEALHISQVLEMGVRSLVAVLNARGSTTLDADMLILKNDRSTLGQLINRLRDAAQLDTNAEESLRDGLQSRNFIVHSFFVRNNGAFEDNEALEGALNTMKSHHFKVCVAHLIVSAFVQGFSQAFGLDYNNILIPQDT